MNTNPNAKVILCYGDSTTRGASPDDTSRCPADVRWTGQLQARLGEGYYIIEEGMGGRTTNLEDPNPDLVGRNGLSYFTACVQSHFPYDLAIIMLGTNDTQTAYGRSAKEIAEVLGQYCDIVRKYNAKTQILLVSPAYITPVEPIVFYDQSSAQKSRELGGEIKRIAEEKQVYFFDAAEVVTTVADGIHWDIDSHARFAENIEKVVEKIL